MKRKEHGAKRTGHIANYMKSQITNSKSLPAAGQTSSKFQFQMGKQILFRIWLIGIYLKFGA